MVAIVEWIEDVVDFCQVKIQEEGELSQASWEKQEVDEDYSVKQTSKHQKRIFLNLLLVLLSLI